MPTIPIADETVGLDAPGVPTPRLTNATPDASGVNVAEADVHLGKTVEEQAGALAKHIVYTNRLKAQQEDFDKASAFQKSVDDMMNGKDGFLNRMGRNAMGMTHGNDDKIIDKESVLGRLNEMKADMLKDAGPQRQKSLSRLLDRHIDAAYGASSRHEAEQFRVAQKDSLKSLVQANANSFAMDPTSDASKKLLDDTQSEVEKYWRGEGEGDDSVGIHRQAVADSFGKTLTHAQLERNPEMVKHVLNALPMSEGEKGPLMDRVDGKYIEMRRETVWDQVKGLRHQDGTMDLAAVDKQTEHLVSGEQISEGQKKHIQDFVRQKATLADSELKDARVAQNRAFDNQALQAQRNGNSYEQAYEKLVKGGTFVDATDRDAAEKRLFKIFNHDDSVYGDIEKHQTQGQKLAWKQIDDMATVKFGKHTAVLPGDEATGIKSPLKDAYMLEMKRGLMGLPPEQMIERATKALENKVTDKHMFWFDKTVPAWQIQRDSRSLNDQEMAALEGDQKYAALVGPVKAALQARGLKNPGAKDVKEAIDKVKQ